MKIIINDTLTIKEIQDSFSDKYPYLKIEFFSKSHRVHTGTRKEFMINPDTRISDCMTLENSGTLEIAPDVTVAELEKSFAEQFGLYIQVFRKSGDVWIETTVTDDWTLDKQNSEAESFYNHMKNRIQNNKF